MIPDEQLGRVLDAVATRTAYPLSVELGVSVPALTQFALRRAGEAEVYARHPAPCRRLLEQQAAARAARGAVRIAGM